MSRAAVAVLTRVLLVVFTLVLFLRRRVPAVMITGTEVGPFHTASDTPTTIDTARLRESGGVVLQSVLEMAATG